MCQCDPCPLYEWPAIRSGETFPGFDIDVEFSPPDTAVDLVAATITFRCDDPSATLTLTETSGLLIDRSSPPWKIRVETIDAVNLPAGIYYGSLSTVETNSERREPMAFIWTIDPSYS